MPLETALTEKQVRYLKRTTYRYRKQIAAIDPDFDFDWTFDALKTPSDPAASKNIKDWWTR